MRNRAALKSRPVRFRKYGLEVTPLWNLRGQVAWIGNAGEADDAEQSSGPDDQNQSRNEQTEHAPDPSDVLPALGACQLSELRRVGREWDRACGDPEAWRKALP